MCTMKENIFFSNKAQIIGTINAVLAGITFAGLVVFWIIAFIYYLSFHSSWFEKEGLLFFILFLLFFLTPNIFRFYGIICCLGSFYC